MNRRYRIVIAIGRRPRRGPVVYVPPHMGAVNQWSTIPPRRIWDREVWMVPTPSGYKAAAGIRRAFELPIVVPALSVCSN